MIAFYCSGTTPQPPLRAISRSNLAAFSRQAFILTQSEFLGGSLALHLIGPISNQETNSPTYYIIENETHLAYFDLPTVQFIITSVDKLGIYLNKTILSCLI